MAKAAYWTITDAEARKPVSYTHLMSEIKKIATRESYGNALVEVGKEHEDLIVLDAVSYTHLDVYKRQHLYCAQYLD